MEVSVNGKPRRLAKNIERGLSVSLMVDGQPLSAYPGETIAAALLAGGRRTFRHTAPGGHPRGIFCGIGMCFDCLVTVDGTQIRACITPVREGMQVSTSPGQ